MQGRSTAVEGAMHTEVPDAPERARPAPLSDALSGPRKLIVLDLNGTLLFRKKGRSTAPGRVIPRPYLPCFFRYCFGPLYDMDKHELDAWLPPDARMRTWKNRAPYGSHHWMENRQGFLLHPPAARVALMVWSSATSQNVDRMVRSILPGAVQRSLLERVWARETLVTSRDLGRKVPTTKDLAVVWDELGEWERYLRTRRGDRDYPRFRSRVLADVRLRLRQKPSHQDVRAEPESSGRSASDSAGTEHRAELANGEQEEPMPYAEQPLWGPHNTVLLDDSEAKARMQPANHICIPAYEALAANTYQRYRLGNSDKDSEGAAAEDDAELDDYLLQVIGVLDAMLDVSDVRAFIQGDGVRGLSASQSEQEHARLRERGCAVLTRCGIPIEP